MDVEMVVGALRRHWWASLLTMALTVVAIAVVPRQISSEFQVVGDVILLSPSTVDNGAADVQVNPWSRFGGAEAGAAAALVTVMNGASLKHELVVGEVKQIDVGINRSNGAIIGVSVTATSAEAALSSYRRVVDELDEQLRVRQQASGAPEPTWLHIDALTVPTRAEELPGSRTRAMAALAALGVVASVCAAIVLDATVSARLRNRSGSKGGRVLPPLHPHEVAGVGPADPDSAVSRKAWRRGAQRDADVHVLNGRTRVAHGGRRR